MEKGTPGKGYSPIHTWEWGTPPTSWMGYPPVQTWEWGTPHQLDGVPPPSRPGNGVTPLSAGWGTPPHQLDGVPPAQTWDRVPPPPEMVDKVKTLPSVILRMRAVIID